MVKTKQTRLQTIESMMATEFTVQTTKRRDEEVKKKVGLNVLV